MTEKERVRDSQRRLHLRGVAEHERTEVYDGLGADLRAARLARGDSLAEMANRLRIRESYLAAMEAGRFADLPGAVYAVGFIRTYGEAVGLGGQACVERYKRESTDRPTDAQLHFRMPASENRLPGIRVMIFSLLLAGAVYGGWHYVSSEGRLAVETVPPVPDRLAAGNATPLPALAQPAPGLPLPGAEGAAPSAPTAVTDSTDRLGNSAVLAQSVAASAEAHPHAGATGAGAPAAASATTPMSSVASPPAGATPSAAIPSPEAPTAAPPPSAVASVSSPTSSARSAPMPEPAPVPAPAAGPVAAATPPAPAPAAASPVAPPAVSLDRLSANPATAVLAPPPVAVEIARARPGAVPPAVEAEESDADESDVTPPPSVRTADAQGSVSVASLPPLPGPPPLPSTSGSAATATDGAYVPQVFGAVDADARVVVTARRDSWVQVMGSNSELLLTRILRTGDKYYVPNRPGLQLMTGNAGALEVAVDGRSLPPLGPVGAVKRNISLNPGDLLGQATSAGE